MLCREHLTQLRRFQKEFEALNVSVAVVTFDDQSFAEAYVKDTGLGWPLLLDRERTLYDAYGMLQASTWDLYRPSSIWQYLKLLARGRPLRRPGRDVNQLGGDVLVDPEGVVRMHFIGSGPADRPPVDSILHHVRAAALPD